METKSSKLHLAKIVIFRFYSDCLKLYLYRICILVYIYGNFVEQVQPVHLEDSPQALPQGHLIQYQDQGRISLPSQI